MADALIPDLRLDLRRPRTAVAFVAALAALAGTALAVEAPRPVPVVGAACEGCDAVFDGMPATIDTRLVLAPADEPGERLVLDGRVLDRRGRPVEGVVIYAYQTDASGLYPRSTAAVGPAARRHGRLRGWVASGTDGGYRIETVRPGAYPGEDLPQHIHVHVVEPGCGTYFIDDVMFADDPLVDPASLAEPAMGGRGLVEPRRVDGVWQARRDVVLGLAVPGYPACGRG